MGNWSIAIIFTNHDSLGPFPSIAFYATIMLVYEFITTFMNQIQVEITLQEIERLQEEEPPINDDVKTVLELDQREYENSQEVRSP